MVNRQSRDDRWLYSVDQYKTAEQDPPHLAAIAPDEALADIQQRIRPGRDHTDCSFDVQYLGVQGRPGLLKLPNYRSEHAPRDDHRQGGTGDRRPVALDYLENPFDDAFCRIRSPITQVAKIKVPVFVEEVA